MKSLKPSHREKKRYLLLEGDISEKDIEKVILDYVGVLGYSKVSPKIITKLKKATILSINRQELDKVRAAFLFSGKIKIRKVSGSLKKLK
jgi:RNase P/RNase MRP subunit POP5